jgi:hypothetical protein
MGAENGQVTQWTLFTERTSVFESSDTVRHLAQHLHTKRLSAYGQTGGNIRFQFDACKKNPLMEYIVRALEGNDTLEGISVACIYIGPCTGLRHNGNATHDASWWVHA